MAFEVGLTHRRVPHLVADLIELVVLTRFSGIENLAKASLADFLGKEAIHPEELDVLDSGAGDAEKNDSVALWVEDVWKQLKYRDSTFKDNYPFDVDGNIIKLNDNQTDGMRIYKLLLVCSRLRSFQESYRVLWAKYFTKLSSLALGSLFKEEMVVRIFDANSDDRRSYYGTDLRDALIKLGGDLSLHRVDEDECRRQSSSGDYGIDLVAHYPIGDRAAGNFVFLGQCGAQEKEWPSKRFEGNPIALSLAYTFMNQPVHSLFIPLCYRDSTGRWDNGSKVVGCLLFDRNRIINLVSKRPDLNSVVNSDWFNDFEDKFDEAMAN